MSLPINRREFFRRAAKTGALAAAVAGGAAFLHDPRGPKDQGFAPGLFSPDFSVPQTDKRLCIVHSADRKKALSAAVAALGGMGRFVQKGQNVALKVNAAFASPPVLGATTHPDLVFAMAKACFAAGAKNVFVTDNSINDPTACFDLSGIAAAARKAGAKVRLPSPGLFSRVTVPDTRYLRNWPVMTGALDRVHRVIGLAPVKDHHRSGASLSMKNWYGLLGGARNRFHQDIHTIIRDLAVMIRPTFVVVDGTMSMMANGPTGGSMSDLKATATLIVSTDQVAADAAAARLLNREPQSLPYLAKARAAGRGEVDYQSLNPIEIREGDLPA